MPIRKSLLLPLAGLVAASAAIAQDAKEEPPPEEEATGTPLDILCDNSQFLNLN